MKPRKVVVMLEMTTVEKLKHLRDKASWEGLLGQRGYRPDIHQTQANVVKPPKERKKTP